jgi:hypothetical protein
LCSLAFYFIPAIWLNMAAENETPFTTLLRADSEHALPDDDGEVTVALVNLT